MKTYTVSLAVLMLLGEANTRTIRHEMPGAYDFIEYVDDEADEEA
jgi:hypothetical protein